MSSTVGSSSKYELPAAGPSPSTTEPDECEHVCRTRECGRLQRLSEARVGIFLVPLYPRILAIAELLLIHVGSARPGNRPKRSSVLPNRQHVGTGSHIQLSFTYESLATILHSQLWQAFE